MLRERVEHDTNSGVMNPFVKLELFDVAWRLREPASAGLRSVSVYAYRGLLNVQHAEVLTCTILLRSQVWFVHGVVGETLQNARTSQCSLSTVATDEKFSDLRARDCCAHSDPSPGPTLAISREKFEQRTIMN